MKKEILKDIFLIGIGAFIYAFGLNYFFVANRLADGGLAGISLIFHYLMGVDIGITYLLLNIPLIILGYKFIGKSFVLKTLYGTFMTSIAIRICSYFQGTMDDKLIAAIFGGLIIGIGLGIIFLGGGSSGGSDIIVKILNKYFDIPVGKAFLFLDFIVLSASGFLFGRDVFMYTLVGLFVSTLAIDFIHTGMNKTKALMIISEKNRELKDEIMEHTGRGTTIINGRGGYTDVDKEILYCMVSTSEVGLIKRIIRKRDPKAFISIFEVSEVLGEGFKDLIS